jgi:outer membrane protein assembly factor BamA
LGYDFLKRQNSYNLYSFRISAGYLWKENIWKEHDFNPIDINYVQPTNVTPLYRSLAETDATLNKAIEKQFTIGSNYRFTYTNTTNTQKVNTFYFHGGIDLSGNIPGLISGANIREKEAQTLFGAAYSQYIRLETDYRYYVKVGPHSKIAARVFGGFGYAYGNSLNLPFVKQYFIGGTNSIRAFRARSIGPGTYYAPDDPGASSGFTADQSGDIKFEFNLEYRPRLSGIVHGALFLDGGNIWLLNDDLDPNARKPGSLFSSSFLKELALGTGIGLRFDFSFLILRTDLAIPIRKPWLPAGEQWVLDELDFGNPIWRRENLIFNLAIGYPF